MRLFECIQLDQHIYMPSFSLIAKTLAFYTKALIFLLFTGALNQPAFADINSLSPLEIVNKLQQGGYILYIRHAATNRSQLDTDISDLSRCEFQRNLNQKGKDESRLLGIAIKQFKIKVGNVFTSPYCRCVDTAKIIFDTYEIDNSLRTTSAANEKDSAMLRKELKAKLSNKPSKDSNTFLVSHSTNLRELAKVWPKPEGAALLIKPLGEDGYDIIGQILPTDWTKLIHEK